ncbi:MAG: hypothetical protein QM730_09945 [Anaerolineales bacterium]
MILILSLFLTSCGSPAATEAPAATQAPAIQAPAATEAPATESPATEAPAQPLLPDTSSANTIAAEPSQTAVPSRTTVPSITQTETELPALLLPTEAVNAPATLVWDGEPTYLGDSQPGYAFRVIYNPDIWALTADQFGFPALGHRNIPGCVISVTSGRGMPANIVVEHDVLDTGKITFDVGIAYENGVKKFVTYTGGDGTIVTAFEVDFTEQSDACIADAVTVLSTLRSVPVSQATPQP